MPGHGSATSTPLRSKQRPCAKAYASGLKSASDVTLWRCRRLSGAHLAQGVKACRRGKCQMELWRGLISEHSCGGNNWLIWKANAGNNQTAFAKNCAPDQSTVSAMRPAGDDPMARTNDQEGRGRRRHGRARTIPTATAKAMIRTRKTRTPPPEQSAGRMQQTIASPISRTRWPIKEWAERKPRCPKAKARWRPPAPQPVSTPTPNLYQIYLSDFDEKLVGAEE